MTKRWQTLQKEFLAMLKLGESYTVYNCGKTELTGIYKGYEKGRYLFECNNGLYKVNLHKMKEPEVFMEIPLF